MTQAETNRSKKRGLLAALAALALVALALIAAGLVRALDDARGLQVAPSSIHFGDQDVGRRSAAQTVAVTNHGGQPAFRSIRIDGEHARDFSVTDASTCVPGPFPTDASCTIVVRFTPTEQGDRTALLGVQGFSGGPVVLLWGTGRTT